jgi:hypothetical protein
MRNKDKVSVNKSQELIFPYICNKLQKPKYNPITHCKVNHMITGIQVRCICFNGLMEINKSVSQAALSKIAEDRLT